MDQEQHNTPTPAPESAPSMPSSAPAQAKPAAAASTSPKSFGVVSDANRRDRASRDGGRGRGARGGKDGKRGGGRSRADRPRQEFDQKSIDVRRVARVVAGGRRFSFAVSMIIGDRKGRVGVGTGKAGDISMAMDKANKDAKKRMITLSLTKTHSIPHQVDAKSSSAVVEIIPAPSRGLVAGSAVRNVLELAGVTDVTAKIRSGSKNKLNMARATLKALSTLRTPKKSAVDLPPAEVPPQVPVETKA